jgi:hypothetical protein
MTTTDVTDDHWLHFGLDDDEIAEYSAPREDIPAWLESSLWGWIQDAFTAPAHAPNPAHIDLALVRRCERILEVRINWPATNRDSFLAVLRHAHTRSPDAIRKVWRLVNYLLGDGHAHGGTLKTYLLEARSVYTVAPADGGKCYLVRRLPEGVETALADTVQHGKAGKRLAAAWEAVFGVDPDPSKGYRLAIKAVEAASVPIVIPDDPSPTLGKVNQRIEQGGQFKLPHLREAPGGVTPHDVLLNNLKQLWWGQYDRHDGLPASTLPDDVTQDEAESAVMLAVTLVGWFATGKVQK